MSQSSPTSSSAVSAAARLRSAFAAKPIDQCALKDAVRAYVDELKKVGAPIERAIVEIKRIAEAGLGPTVFRGRMVSEGDESGLQDQAVTWCIDRYYETRDS